MLPQTGTGAFTLGATQTGFESFGEAIGNNNTTYYCIFNQGTDQFEVGLGTLNANSTTLTRTTVLTSSNSDNAVDFDFKEQKMYFVHYLQVRLFT